MKSIGQTVEHTALRLGDQFFECDDCGTVSASGGSCPKCGGDMELQKGMGIPEPRARAKAEATTFGMMLVRVGLLMTLTAPAIAVAVLLTGNSVTWQVLALCAVIGAPGLLAFSVGANMVSREAAPMLAKGGEFVVKVLKIIFRVKNGAT